MNTPITSTFRGNRHIISKTVTDNYTIADNIEAVNVDATGGPITITLPLISLNIGRLITVRKIDASANIVTIVRTSPDLYQGATSTTLNDQWAVLSIDNDGTEWRSTNRGATGSAGPAGDGYWDSITEYTLQTTDNTLTTAVSLTVPAGSIECWDAIVMGKQDDFTDGGATGYLMMQRIGTFVRAATGRTYLVTQATSGGVGVSGLTTAFNIGGTGNYDGTITVTGNTAHTVDWYILLRRKGKVL